MLDTTLINVSIPVVSTKNSKALVLSGCRVVLSENIPYSELDELNYYSLNCNDYGHGGANIELNFENKFQNPYFKFFAQCIAIRTDREILCKINLNSMSNVSNISNYSKITKDGKLALGIYYYFRSQKEQEQLIKCHSFSIEGFIALKKKTNVYGFMCQIEQTNDGWQMIEGNTYQIYKHANITGLYH